ncbi:MAG: hypothetical protein HXX14_19130 [Bacteroidetes bacterium]|nr:hypothetical protein [Bacteroidota bacterium]
MIIAYRQLRGLNKNRKGDFSHRFKKDFFCKNTRQLLFFIYSDLLIFRELQSDPDHPYFKINKDKLDKLPDAYVDYKNVAKDMNYQIDPFKIDDYLLGHFEDMGFFVKKGILEIEYIYVSFDWYIKLTHENCSIRKYIKWLQKQANSEDVYENFQYIAEECKLYRIKKIGRNNIDKNKIIEYIRIK